MRIRILCFVLILTAYCCLIPADAATDTQIHSDHENCYTNDFDTGNKEYIEKDSMLCWNTSGISVSSVLASKDVRGNKDSWFAFGTSGRIKSPSSVSADITVVSEKSETVSHALNIGVRVEGQKGLYINQGLWFLIKKNVLTAHIQNKDNITINSPLDFSKTRRVYVEDTSDEISLFANNDSGVKTLLMRVRLENGNANVFDGSGTQKGTFTQPGLSTDGYIRFMSHYAETIIDNFSLTYTYDPYVPVDPSLYRDTYSDTWVATDGIGRRVNLNSQVTGSKKYVGVFYFLWHDVDSGPIYDHYQSYLDGGLAAVWNVLQQGDRGYAHYWGQPYFGYYRSDDEWVIRKHAQMLTNAGVDFIFFDTSNGRPRSPIFNKILETYVKIRQEGGTTPQIAFLCGENSAQYTNVVTSIWNEMYSQKKYQDLWFLWEGKPLLLSATDGVPAHITENFTVRRSWAFNSWTGDGIGKWPWIADYPQNPGKDPNTGAVEQVTVSSGFHANSSKGRSYVGGKQTSAGYSQNTSNGTNDFEFSLINTSGKGLALQEQWKRVYELSPELVMVTGWNEWWAGRWDKGGSTLKIANTYLTDDNDSVKTNYYVDTFNPEFSRDIEPMKGGFGDNFYYQMASYIRKFKGTRPASVATSQKKINISQGFAQWQDVSPEYRDTLYDTTHRNSKSFGGSLTYVNNSGRNDLDTAKVSVANGTAGFYIRAWEAITAPESGDQTWMNLYLDTDQNPDTGWQGYDYLLNRSRTANTVSVEKYGGSGYTWQKVGDAPYVVSGQEMQITLPVSLLGRDTLERFDFKWADHSLAEDDVMKFTDMGDAAPDDRFRYRYETSCSTPYSDDGTKRIYQACNAELTGADIQWDKPSKNVGYWTNKTQVSFLLYSDREGIADLSAITASEGGGSTSLQVNGRVIQTLSVPSTGDWQQYQPVNFIADLVKGDNGITLSGGSGFNLKELWVSDLMKITQTVLADDFNDAEVTSGYISSGAWRGRWVIPSVNEKYLFVMQSGTNRYLHLGNKETNGDNAATLVTKDGFGDYSLYARLQTPARAVASSGNPATGVVLRAQSGAAGLGNTGTVSSGIAVILNHNGNDGKNKLEIKWSANKEDAITVNIPFSYVTDTNHMTGGFDRYVDTKITDYGRTVKVYGTPYNGAEQLLATIVFDNDAGTAGKVYDQAGNLCGSFTGANAPAGGHIAFATMYTPMLLDNVKITQNVQETSLTASNDLYTVNLSTSIKQGERVSATLAINGAQSDYSVVQALFRENYLIGFKLISSEQIAEGPYENDIAVPDESGAYTLKYITLGALYELKPVCPVIAF